MACMPRWCRRDGFAVTRAAFVWANIPPARVWVYRKDLMRFCCALMLQQKVQHK